MSEPAERASAFSPESSSTGEPLYADISLPVPLDQAFTYRLPPSMRTRIQVGCRVLVPLGTRKLTGIVLRLHSTEPPPSVAGKDVAFKDVARLLDEEPVLSEEILALGEWIASYYCAPLGEVLRSMSPLATEIRQTRSYSLTEKGRDTIRQFLLGTSDDDPAVAILRLLEPRSMSGSYIQKMVPRSEPVLKGLVKKGLVEIENATVTRDPLRSPAARLRVEFLRRPQEARPDDASALEIKLNKAERETLAYLELHPGPHNLATLEADVKNAGSAARSLARRGLVRAAFELPGLDGLGGRPAHALNSWQQRAFETIAAGLEGGAFHPYLLQGVTGSGKTEVYMRLIDHALGLGRNVLMLVPEIGLTPAVAGQFFHRFGDRVAILHSAFSDTERTEQWRRIRAGSATVVVGTRSGIFAPVRNIGLIIVDEEHDQSYKQEETPRYQGRDVAIVRARMAGACVVLGSATPSLESRHNADSGKYTRIEMPERIASRPMPEVSIVDMRQEFLENKKNAPFSRAMIESLRARLDAHEQAMVLMNRRGYSSVVTCRSCGETIHCQNCAVSLTFHKRDKRLLCHYCGYSERVSQICPKCGSEHVYFLGTGSEKVEDELSREFPEARIARLDRDTVTNKRDYENILRAFRDHDYEILVGTQMIAKGHDIPNVTFVGIVNADTGLGMPDFRAAERSFQLLTQAAGRAGRGETPGQVLIQTVNPEHYAIRFAAAQDYEHFYEKELEFRRMMRYPPFTALANLLVRSPSQEAALRLSSELAEWLKPAPENVRVLGPAEAAVPKLKTEFRYQLLLKAASRKRLNLVLRDIRSRATEANWPATALVIDVDPYSLM